MFLDWTAFEISYYSIIFNLLDVCGLLYNINFIINTNRLVCQFHRDVQHLRHEKIMFPEYQINSDQLKPFKTWLIILLREQ